MNVKLFNSVPKKCCARALIQAVYSESIKNNNPTIVLGYINKETGMKLFGGNLDEEVVELSKEDLIIVYSNH